MKQTVQRALFALFCISTIALMSACGGPSSGKILPIEDQYSKATKLYERGKFFESAEEFQKVIYNYPGATAVDSAQYFLALSYMHDGQFELAAVEFDRLIRSYPSSPFVTESHFRVGYCYFHAAPKHYGLDQTELVQAIRLMEDFIIDFPDSDFVPEARKSLAAANTRLSAKDFSAAVQYSRIRAWESARIYYQRILDNYPDSEYRAHALLGKGEALYFLSNWDDAAQSLNSYLAQYSDRKHAKKARELLAKVESDRPKAPVDSTDTSGGEDTLGSLDSKTSQSSAPWK